MVHCIKVLVVEDGLESLNEGCKAEGEEKDEGANGADDFHPTPSKGVSQPRVAPLASGQVAPFRPGHQRHQQGQHVVHVLQLIQLAQNLLKDIFNPPDMREQGG